MVPLARRQWEPLARNRVALPALAGGLVLLWALRLGQVINGWLLFGGAVVLALAALGYATERQASSDAAQVPVEWWGVRRAWRPEDEEVLARGIAGS